MSDCGRIGDIKKTSRVGEHELSVEWRIHDVLSLEGGNEDYYDSAMFFHYEDEYERDVCPEFHFNLYPNWKKEERHPASSGYLKLELCRIDPGPAATFHVSLGIRGSAGVENSREVEKELFSEDEYGCQWDDFCSRRYLKESKTRMMPDGTLTIVCLIKKVVPGTPREAKILLRSERNVLKSGEDSKVTLKEQAADELQSSLQSQLKSEGDCDVVLKVQEKEFRAHRLILRSRSAVLQAMFSRDEGVVTMEHCDQDTFPAFLQHVYTGSLEVISDGNVFGLYTSSEKYGLKTLRKACAEFITENLSVSSFCDVMAWAVSHDDRELIESATEFFCNNALGIVKTPQWDIFLAANPTVAKELHIKQLTK